VPPAPDNSVAAKAARRKTDETAKANGAPSSVATDPAPKAGKKKAKDAENAERKAPSSSPIPRKRGRKATELTEPTKSAPSATIRDDGQWTRASQFGTAVVSPLPDGQGNRVSHLVAAIGESDRADHEWFENQRSRVGTVAQIQAGWRMRQRWHKAEKALTLQAKALCRGLCNGDKEQANEIFDAAYKSFKAADKGKSAPAGIEPPFEALIALDPFLPAILRFEKQRTDLEKDMAKQARRLPAYDWAMSFRGFGEGSFVAIIGETAAYEEDGTIRTIGDYRTVSGLWKRLGLGLIDGERQRKVADAELAIRHGYSPARRSVAWNVGGALIGGMGRGPRPEVGADLNQYEWTYWQRLFVERCRYECARDPDKMPLKTAMKEGVERESYPKHAQARAKRYVEKRFIRKLYARWRLETRGVSGDPDEQEFTLPLAAE
jgi:hypothetical protein